MTTNNRFENTKGKNVNPEQKDDMLKGSDAPQRGGQIHKRDQDPTEGKSGQVDGRPGTRSPQK